MPVYINVAGITEGFCGGRLALARSHRQTSKLDESVIALLEALRQLPAGGGLMHDAASRVQVDLAALRYHLQGLEQTGGKAGPSQGCDTSQDNHQKNDQAGARMVAIIGGTGTGKSTLVNRLIETEASASSYRRTFTCGPVAAVDDPAKVPAGWLQWDHVLADQVPARGKAGVMILVTVNDASERGAGLLDCATLVDTPDLDGDQPEHAAIADRVFRWAQQVIFLVTPEKYQMTELLPYYRLARRYEVPAVFVMNKCEQSEVLEDYRRQLAGWGWPGATVYAMGRDDSTYNPPAEESIDALRAQLTESPDGSTAAREGIANRKDDVVDRVVDQVIEPLAQQAQESRRLAAAVQAMEAPTGQVDVNPVTQQLHRRLQQRSILYLIGPGRVIDRLRQAPALLARLPRRLFDLARGKEGAMSLPEPEVSAEDGSRMPDFPSLLADQFVVLQSAIDDCLRDSEMASGWMNDPARGYSSSRLGNDRAAAIGREELEELKRWLEKHWNAHPRDTRLLMKLIKHLPGGQKLTQWSEAAPYLLTIIVATHHAMFGHIDLLIIGGYSLATWLSERLSNEVSSRTRAANKRIALRFAELAHDQIQQTRQWLLAQSPDETMIARLRQLTDQLAEAEV